MAKPTQKQQRQQRQPTGHAWLRRTLAFLGLVAVAGLVYLGWRWQETLPVRAVTVSGAVHADTTALLALAAVADSSMLFDLDPTILADRVQRHPWVAEASVTRWMTGTVGISVEERVPVALVLDGSGRPTYFFDAAGFMMPLAPRTAYDVPLLQGHRWAFHPTQPTDDAATLDLLAALAALDEHTDALVSSIERTATGFVLTTSPGPTGAIPVALGRDGFGEKFQRLRAFWDQAVLSRPDTPVRRIDLRFDGQIVTQES